MEWLGGWEVGVSESLQLLTGGGHRTVTKFMSSHGRGLLGQFLSVVVNSDCPIRMHGMPLYGRLDFEIICSR